ncbi:alpha/beta hydrolase [uncultured Sphaerochaeta sp.]|uniref:alpha/beta hydrolase n=1 Tax=uncultured Sphaerochaeta sp. TaxID=886478 RepID=UPI002A0A51EF|nr:alpha/beta hydrolase [uncultured Sphaerochaeta sp.]
MKNTILKELQPILEAASVIDLKSGLADARSLPATQMEHLDTVLITTRTIQGPACPLTIRIYEPIDHKEHILPALFWSHGGGYVLGKPEFEDGICERFVQETDCVVVQVNYRLAPEHVYPAAIEDSYAGLKWMVDNSPELRIDRSKIAIAGPSAGGGLTAALALMARDRKELQILFQMLLYPMIDDRNNTASCYEINKDAMPKAWNRENNIIAWQMYLGNDFSGTVSPYAAPARAKDLTNLPSAYLCIGQQDPFRDETIDYAARLARAGIPVEFHMYPGCFHGFDFIANKTEICERCRTEYIIALKRAFGGIES